MAENNVLEKKPVAAAAPLDLSKEIEQSMQREPDERIKVVRVFGDCYRCNLWAADKSDHPFWLATGTIKESRFLRATKTSAGLLIEDVAR